MRAAGRFGLAVVQAFAQRSISSAVSRSACATFLAARPIMFTVDGLLRRGSWAAQLVKHPVPVVIRSPRGADPDRHGCDVPGFFGQSAGSSRCADTGLTIAVRGTPGSNQGGGKDMSVTAFQDLPLAERDREWTATAAERRVRKWADAEDEPEPEVPRRPRLVRQRQERQFRRLQTADRRHRQRQAHGGPARSDGSRRGYAGLTRRCRPPEGRHRPGEEPLAKYYNKMDESPPWDRD